MFTVGLHSGGEVVALPKSLHFPVERVDDPDEPGGRTRRCPRRPRTSRGAARGRSPVVAQGGSQAVVGDAVAAGERDALDEPVQPQPAQVVGHAAATVLLHGQAPMKRCRGLAQVPVPEAVRQHPEASSAASRDCTRGSPKRRAEARCRSTTRGRWRSSNVPAPMAQSWLTFWTRSRRRLAANPIFLRSSRFFSRLPTIEWSLPVLRTGCR